MGFIRSMRFLIDGRCDPNAYAAYDAASAAWYTYGALQAEVDRVAERLRHDRKLLVFCFIRNNIRSVTAYLGALEAGHAVVLLDPDLEPSLKLSLIALYRPGLILESGDTETPGRSGYRCGIPTEDGPSIWSSDEPAAGEIHEQLTLLLSTSGSTGSPKLVRLSRDNVLSNALAIRDALEIGSDERAISSLPFYYSYGLSVLHSHLAAGASVVLTDEKITSSAFWERVRATECTSFAGVPYMYMILDRLRLDNLNVPSLKTLTQAGGKLGNELIFRFHQLMSRRGGRFFVMYGQTEATARIAVLPHSCLPEKLGSVGKAILGGTLRVEQADGEPAGPGQSGELVFNGPNVMMGYASGPDDLALGDAMHGELRTQDIGCCDADGFFVITGRSRRFAKLFGLRINLDEIEAMLKVHGPTAVIDGENQLLIYCEHGESGHYAEYGTLLADRLKLHKTAFRFHKVDRLPLTSNGKIDYPRLQTRP